MTLAAVGMLLISAGAAASEEGPPLMIPEPAQRWRNAQMIVGEEGGWHSDFCFIKDRAGRWHAIGIGGPQRDDRTMFHAVSDTLTGRYAYLPKVGPGPEAPPPLHMWAPFAIWQSEDLAFMYYCHMLEDHSVTFRVLESRAPDLSEWRPYSGQELGGDNVMLRDPGNRDACVFWDAEYGVYRMYYASEGIWMRTSKDLLNWSEHAVVMQPPPHYQAAESPFVLKRDGLYYLWVSGFDYARMSLYVSEDPAEFGDPADNRIMEQNGHAPEIVSEGGIDYMGCAAIHTNFEEPYNPPGASDLNGVYIQPLRWRAATQHEAGRVVRKTPAD